MNGDPQVRVFIYITWYKGEPAWTHALEGPHYVSLIKESTVKCTERLLGAFCFEFGSLYLTAEFLKLASPQGPVPLLILASPSPLEALKVELSNVLISTQRTPEEALIWLVQSHVNRLWDGHLKLSERGHNARPHYAVRKQLKIKLVKSLNRNQNTLFIWKITGE